MLRPGRLDRKIEFPQPGRREKRLIFQVLTAGMNLSEELDLEDYVSRPEKISGAEISCIVQEAGMQAVRNNRYVVMPKDFEKGYKANTQKNDKDFEVSESSGSIATACTPYLSTRLAVALPACS